MVNHLFKPITRKRANLTLSLFFFLLLFVAGNHTIFAQSQNTVSGIVTDETGIPLPGVTVMVKDTSYGVITDFDGNYKISINSLNPVLIFSYIGYLRKEIEVNDRNQINLTLEKDVASLDEVVVVGYGSVKRKDLTGSVASVNMDKLNKAPVSSFDEALAGRATGVQVSSASGEPGQSSEIVIRGGNTVNGDNSPLYVLDGFIIDDFNPGLLDPTDIQSIDILKDASATAIYGARGANGVVLITTKQAKSGKTKVSFETRIDVNEVNNTIPVLSSYEFVKLANEISPTRAEGNYFVNENDEVVGGVEDYRNSPTENWQDEAFRTAYTKTHRLKMSGGSDKTKVDASLNYLDEEGTLIQSHYKRINGRLNIKQEVNDKTDVSLNVIYSNEEQLGLDTQGTSTYSFMRNLISYAPVANKFIDYGDANPLYQITDEFYEDAIFNWQPILSLNNEYRKRERDRIITNLSVSYKILPSLTFETRGSYNGQFRKTGRFNNSKTVYGRLVNPINGINGSLDYQNFKTLSTVNTLTYNQEFGDHGITALLGYTLNTQTVERTIIDALQIPQYAESQGINALDEGELGTTSDFNGSQSERIESVLARLNYSYKDRYLLTTSIRRDGSSAFAPGYNIDYFPSLAVSWKAEEEEFIKNIDFISQLKFKAGYGKTGNDRIPNNVRFDLFTSNLASYFLNGEEVLGQRPTAAGANPRVEWETTEQYNAGLDLGLLEDRISLSVEIYKKTTEDLLINADTPPSQGITSVWKNIGSVGNKGIEFALHTVNISTENFQWITDFNISFNESEVISLPEGKPIFGNPNYYSRYASNQFIVEEGKPLGNMYGYISDGVYQPEDFANYDPNAASFTLNPTQPSYRNTHQPGDEKYKDVNGDGVISSADKTIIGNGLPEHFGGLNNTFIYKNFTLSAFLQWSYGNDILNANRLVFEEVQYGHQNQYATVTNRWTPTNQDTDMFRAGGRGFEDISSRIVEDGSYLRLKTVNLSYNLPRKDINKIGLTSANIYLAGQNLITWTDYSGYDPEVSVNNSAIMPGVDYSAYPRSRTYSFGVKVSF
ncbi:TonB-dependent receptor [Gramella sp. AN32]|uniref:SusC/RagA family TonB-linked outer membrane protein n=1 Tax=Christiangramia antarctica TaxID=2058158 RepID=A0ABW5X4F8_9FLAO|nr:TonB-dependent receptor [Gramella sp. AN32]MCM4157047.1 SusC/RagA family TonB-linked outer membrane protein [Gramella sp. AN32]